MDVVVVKNPKALWPQTFSLMANCFVRSFHNTLCSLPNLPEKSVMHNTAAPIMADLVEEYLVNAELGSFLMQNSKQIRYCQFNSIFKVL